MATILLLTASYPFSPGEEFFEEEMQYWARAAEVNRLVIAPMRRTPLMREVPEGLTLDMAIPDELAKSALRSYGRALTSALFWREVLKLTRSGRLTGVRVAAGLRACATTIRIQSALGILIRRHGHIDLAYSYWNDVQSFAAILLKRQGVIGSVVSRAHGFDLYEERRRGSYIPLKDQLISEYDQIYCVSAKGKKYLDQRYPGEAKSRVHVARLGTSSSVAPATPATPLGQLHIVSISSCTPVKRIDKIIEAISILARLHPGQRFHWTHIGDGQLLEAHQQQAVQALSGIDNVSYRFAGRVPHPKIFDFFGSNEVDLLLNTSESEGVPVSLMEAMACGVPALAPNVGGVEEIIPTDLPFMMSESPSPDEIARAISRSIGLVKNGETRRAVADAIARDYDASTNYRQFVAAMTCSAESVE